MEYDIDDNVRYGSLVPNWISEAKIFNEVSKPDIMGYFWFFIQKSNCFVIYNNYPVFFLSFSLNISKLCCDGVMFGQGNDLLGKDKNEE